MKVVIIEDEKPAARRLSRMLNEIGLHPIAMIHSVNEAIDWFLNNSHPDIIFLDIQLSDGLSFEIFEEVHIESAIIFTTAYDKYALKAFKLNSVDYLLKPIDEDELKAAVKKYESIQNNAPKIDLNILKSLISTTENNYKQRFMVKVGQHLKTLKINTIECFYSANKTTNIYTTNKRTYLIDDTLDILDTKLNPNQFYRVNRKFIININEIKDIISYSNSRLKLHLNNFNEEEIIVSRERVKDFKMWIS